MNRYYKIAHLLLPHKNFIILILLLAVTWWWIRNEFQEYHARTAVLQAQKASLERTISNLESQLNNQAELQEKVILIKIHPELNLKDWDEINKISALAIKGLSRIISDWDKIHRNLDDIDEKWNDTKNQKNKAKKS